MSKFILTESQYKKLIEQTSNSSAMDLDIYTQPMTTASDNGNSDVEDAVDDIISKMNELRSMIKSGKQIHNQSKIQIFKNLDQINQTFSNIKYEY
jgi:dihydroorotase